MNFPSFSIVAAGSIGRIGGSAVAPLSAYRVGNAVEEAMIGRACGTSLAA